jgi:hypothetical protein
MKIVTKVWQETFEHNDSKEAYLKACKWVANNLLKIKVEVGELMWNINRIQEADLPTYKLEVFSAVDETEFKNSFCKRCQEFHKAFYLNQQFNCDNCNMTGYREQLAERLRIIKNYRQKQIRNK